MRQYFYGNNNLDRYDVVEKGQVCVVYDPKLQRVVWTVGNFQAACLVASDLAEYERVNA